MQTSGNQIYSPYIPKEAYLFFPKIDNSQHPDKPRIFFDGNIQFTFYENEMIKKFREYTEKENYTLKPLWTDNMILRFLYANDFNLRKTLFAIKEQTIWREANLPVHIDESLEKVLNSGLIYIHGRDKEFRPIIVFNIHLINPKTANFELIKRALTFWIEHVVDEWMLPGQVENWVFISDIKDIEPCVLTHPAMKDLLAFLQDNHQRRLHKLHVVNVPASLYVPWRIIKKKFLTHATIQRTKIYKGNVPTELLESTNLEQIEQQYGGLAKNATYYWPPTIPSNNYFVTPEDSETLITQERYTSLYQSGSLSKMRVSQSLIDKYADQQPEAPEKQDDQLISSFPLLPLLPLLAKVSSVLESDLSVAVEDNKDENDVMEDKIKAVMREFQSSFLEDIHSH